LPCVVLLSNGFLVYTSLATIYTELSTLPELSQEILVRKMRDDLGLPVICSKAIPDGIIDRFERWHMKVNV